MANMGAMVSKRVALAAGCASLALAGCQTGSEGVNVFPTVMPSLESGFSLSNDPSRLGRTHLAAGNYAMAERSFQYAVEKNRQDADSWMGLAAAYDHLGRFDLSDRAYAQVLSLRGETLELTNNLGYSYMLRGEGRRARDQFERALALDPGNAVIANNIKLLRLGERQVRGPAL